MPDARQDENSTLPSPDAALAGFQRVLARREDVHEFSAPMINLAAEITRHAIGVDEEDMKALLVLVLASMLEQRHGSTRLPLDETLLRRRFVEITGEERADALVERALSLVSGSLADLVGGADAYRPLILEDGALYQHRMHHHEQRLARRLATRLERAPQDYAGEDVVAALADVLERMPLLASGEPMSLNPEQQYALLTAVHQPLTLISGGPGTGKTTLLVSLARLAARLGVPVDQIALAAPTGKAANRMGEAFDAQLGDLSDRGAIDQALLEHLEAPRTLHRLLGYSPRRERFHYHRNNPLEARLVVVDEASMIDLFVMERLVDAVPPGASLVLVGDADQLPSVNSGAVFRDLMPEHVHTDTVWREHAPHPVSSRSSDDILGAHAGRLETSYRMDAEESGGAQILELARAVNGDRVSEFFDAEETTGALRELENLGAPEGGVSLVTTDSVGSVARWWYESMVASTPNFRGFVGKPLEFDGTEFAESSRRRLREIFDHYAKSQLMTLTRVLPTGSHTVNDACHARHLQEMQFRSSADFATGDPIIMRKNDYQRGLFNGDHGIVLTVRRDDDSGGEESGPMAVFERADRFVPFSLSGLRAELELAYAITVHKSQGSEFQHVGLLLPDEPIPLLTRELLYTGLTRASESVTVFGEPALLEHGAARGLSRHSGLRERLVRVLGGPANRG